MPWPRVRFTVRRMMIGVALIAALLGADHFRRRILFCRERAADFREMEETYLRLARESDDFWSQIRYRVEEFEKLKGSEEGQELAARNPQLFEAMRENANGVRRVAAEAEHCREVALWSASAREMYDRAIWHPWEAVPDEPAPPVDRWRDREGESE